jgi:hypothetical protein
MSVEQRIPGGLSAEDWVLLTQVLDLIRSVVPPGSNTPPAEVFGVIETALRAQIAPTFQDKEARATLLGVAQVWSRLAHLALANRQVAELTVQIARQRVVVKHALDTGQRSEMAESRLDALEESVRIFEKHRIFLLSCSGSSSALPPSDAATGRSWSRRNGHGAS